MARYLVNSGGIIHSVPDEQFATHLQVARATAMQRTGLGAPFLPDAGDNPTTPMPREATPEEVAQFWQQQGLVYDPETGDAVSKAEADARNSKKAAAK